MDFVNKRRTKWEERREEREKLFKEPGVELVDIEYVKEEILSSSEQLVS